MAIADFGLGVQGGLQQLLARRMMEQKAIEQARQAEFEQAAQTRQMDQGDRRIDLDERGLGLREQEMNQPAAPERPFQIGGRIVTPSGQVVYESPAAAPEPQRPVALSPGGSLVDPATGRIIAAIPDRPEKQGKSVEEALAEYEAKKKIDAQYGGTRPSIGAEKTALNYFNRMLEAERNAREVENDVSAWDTAMSGNIPFMPEFAENMLKSEKGQKYTQAQRMFTEARLRKESGAAIPENEFANDRRMNFRSVGDKGDTLKQKRDSRLATMRGIGNSAGNALREYYGQDATLDSLLAEFAEKEAAATGKPTAADLIKKYGGGSGR